MLRKIVKTILISYQAEKYQALNAMGTTYILVLEHRIFGGLIKVRAERKIEVPYNAYKTTENWDIAIKAQCSVG